jgi:Helix-turn-helix domain
VQEAASLLLRTLRNRYSAMLVRKAYRFRIYPEGEQESLFRRTVGCCRFVKTMAALLSILLVAMFVPSSASAEDGGGPPSIRRTGNVPDLAFLHEEGRLAYWRLDGPRLRRDRFAYLMLDPWQDGAQSRALVVIDSYKNPGRASFLEGEKLLAVSEVKGESLRERIDWPLSDQAALLDATETSAITVNLERNAIKQVRLSFAPALRDFHDKFDFSCLTLPDVLTLTLGTRVHELVILLPGEQRDARFAGRCGDFADGLPSPRFSYVEAARLHFAFTQKRLVIIHNRYVLSVPYDISDEAIGKSKFLITKTQMDKVLNSFDAFPSDDELGPSPVDRDRREVFLIQRRIDDALAALLKNNEQHCWPFGAGKAGACRSDAGRGQDGQPRTRHGGDGGGQDGAAADH